MLLDWFEQQSPLPWQDIQDVYCIWILEIMSQQTTLGTLLIRYPQWLATFPDLLSIVSAEEEEVLRAWEGLGYYSRARNIYKAAKIFFEQGYPEPALKKWLKVPGIGEYTAAAILSQAYKVPILALDVNVKRIITRYFNSVKLSSLQINNFTRELGQVFIDDPGLVNQALIRLGQLVCKANTVDCQTCPLRVSCKSAYRLTSPLIKKSSSIKNKIDSYIVIYFYQNSILTEYIHTGVGKHLYRLPKIQEIFWYKLASRSKNYSIGCYKHYYTKYEDTLHVLLLGEDDKLHYDEILLELATTDTTLRWVSQIDLEKTTFLSAYRKIIDKAISLRKENELPF